MFAYELITNGFLFIALYFEVFLLIAFLEKSYEKKPENKSLPLPKATVIVPCYNEEVSIDRTVASLLALEYPKDKLEIFLVNDGSTDGTLQKIQAYTANPQVRVFSKENGGKHTALNLGISHASGDIIGCLDSDSTVAPNALREVAEVFNTDPKNMAVISSIMVREPKSVLQHMQHAEYALAIFLRKAIIALNGTFVTPGPFSFFRKEVFAEIGTFRSAHNTEDLEIALRMQMKGLRIVDAPKAHVYTKAPHKLSALLKQRVRWIYGFLKNVSDYRFMLFRAKFGHLGIIVLPAAVFSIYSAVFMFTVSIASAGEALAKEFIKVDTLGFTGAIPQYESLDWFYFYTEAVLFLTIMLLALTFALILVGKRLSGQSIRPGFDMIAYFVLYGFIAPLWLMKAMYQAGTSRMPSWTSERK